MVFSEAIHLKVGLCEATVLFEPLQAYFMCVTFQYTKLLLNCRGVYRPISMSCEQGKNRSLVELVLWL